MAINLEDFVFVMKVHQQSSETIVPLKTLILADETQPKITRIYQVEASVGLCGIWRP